MTGIDLNKPALYKHASFRFFEEKEHHTTRFCGDNVLLLVYKGILRFSEDGVKQEVCAGSIISKGKTVIRQDLWQAIRLNIFTYTFLQNGRIIPMRLSIAEALMLNHYLNL